MHYHCGPAGGPLELSSPGPNRRVHNPLEIATRQRIGEDDLGQPRPIVAQYLRAKSIDDGSKRRGPWLDYVTGKHVGVDDDRTARSKFGSHRAFSRRDAPS